MRSTSSLLGAAAACLLAVAVAAPDSAEAGPRKRRKPEVSRAEIVARIDGVLKTGLNTMGTEALAELLLDGDPANDPFLLDIREKKDFKRGHIPGAVNIPLRKFATKWARKRSLIPDDRDVVVISYYGGDGNFASLLINAVRIEDPGNLAAYKTSKTLFMGMMSWSFEPAHSNGHRYDTDLDVMRVDRDTESEANTPGTFASAKWRSVRARSVSDAILQLGRKALKKARKPNDFQVPMTELAEMIDAGRSPQVVSVRGGSHYALGHVPSAINIGWKDVALDENTVKIDSNEPVYVYCYTGHTGSVAAAALRLLGYDARNLLYGMCGWRPSGAVAGTQLTNFDLNRGWDFPVDEGGADDLGTLSAYAPPTGCVACHTSLTGIWYDRTIANAPAEPPAPPSVGEG